MTNLAKTGPLSTTSPLSTLICSFFPSHNVSPLEEQSPFSLSCHFFTKVLFFANMLRKLKF